MLQGNCAVQEEMGVPFVDIEDIDKFIGSGKNNPAKPEIVVADTQEENRECLSDDGAHPPLTDWSLFDQGQIWEIYQGLKKGQKVSTYFNPKFTAREMCEIRMAAE